VVEREIFLGEKLSRQAALGDPTLKEVFSMLDRITEDDHRFRAFLLNRK
jgi:hypothetical protein